MRAGPIVRRTMPARARRRPALRTARQLTMDQRRDAGCWHDTSLEERAAIRAALQTVMKPAAYRDVHGWDVCYAAARLGLSVPDATAWASRQWAALRSDGQS